jgi:hypothetical protein
MIMANLIILNRLERAASSGMVASRVGLALKRAVRFPAYRRLLGDLPGYDTSATGELEILN